MPFVQTQSKKYIEKYQEALEWLEKLWGSRQFEQEFIYRVDDAEGCYESEDGPAILAVGYIDSLYAIYAPEYLNEKQLNVFEFITRKIESTAKIIVFSERDYKIVEKIQKLHHSIGKKTFEVELMIL